MPGGRLRAEQMQRDAQAMLNAKFMEIPQPIALEGKVVGGTWDTTDGSAAFQQGDTASSFGDDSDQNLIKSYPILTGQPGDYYGTVGNEPAIVLQSQCGNVMSFIQSTVNPPSVPSGERWILHYNQAGVVDAFTKHTNDGPTPNDGLGGAHYGGQAALSTQTTKSGHQVTLNDTTQQVQMTSALGNTQKLDDVAKTISTVTTAGHSVVLNDTLQTIKLQTVNGLEGLFDDATQKIIHQTSAGLRTQIDAVGNAISLVTQTAGAGLGLGNVFSSLDSVQNAAPRFSDIDSMLNGTHGINLERLTDLKNLATAVSVALASASPAVTVTPASIIAALASLVNVPTPSCSSIVRIL